MDEPRVSTEHPELHHYTGWEGLKGIIETQTIWATHFSNLNDITEVIHLKDRLTSDLTKRLQAYISMRISIDPEFKKRVRAAGTVAIIAAEESKNFVETLYTVTFEGAQGPPFAAPYVASFCSHSADSRYERQNGLLSQWKGYGRADPYSIVLDTRKLEKLLEKEGKNYEYQTTTIADVVYSNKLDAENVWYTDLVDRILEITKTLIESGEPNLGDLYGDFVLGATRFKHRGFSEEREVRIIANPYTRKMDAYLRNEAPEQYQAPKSSYKDIRKNGANGRSYIPLFDFDQCHRLPIKRIIVGPHSNKIANARKVRELVGRRIKVDVSETPYIG